MIVTSDVRELLNILTEEHYITQIKNIVNDLDLNKDNPEELFIPGFTHEQFKELHGWYGSTELLEYMCNFYTARFTRFFCTIRPSIIKHIVQVFALTIPNEEKAAKKLKEFYLAKYGSVSEERIKEIDSIVEARRLQDGLEVQQILQSGKFPESSGPISN